MKKLYSCLIAGGLIFSSACERYEIGRHHYHVTYSNPERTTQKTESEKEKQKRLEELMKEASAKPANNKLLPVESRDSKDEMMKEAEKDLEKAEDAIKAEVKETYRKVQSEYLKLSRFEEFSSSRIKEAAAKISSYGELAVPYSFDRLKNGLGPERNVACFVLEGAGDCVDKNYKELADAYVSSKKDGFGDIKQPLENLLGKIFERNKEARIAGSKSDDAELRKIALEKLK